MYNRKEENNIKDSYFESHYKKYKSVLYNIRLPRLDFDSLYIKKVNDKIYYNMDFIEIINDTYYDKYIDDTIDEIIKMS